MPAYETVQERVLSHRTKYLICALTMDNTTTEMYMESANFLRDKVPRTLREPRVAIICGSGLGGLAGTVHDKDKVELDYAFIPHFSRSAGKMSMLVIGFDS